MTPPAVTVVIPTHNRRAILEETVRSVRSQTVAVEIVVVDDASTDDTAAWLAEQPDITAITSPTPRGGPVSRNDGVARATADWIAFLDDDDLWAPDKLAAQLASLGDHPSARWSATGCVWIDSGRRVVGARAMPDEHETIDDLTALLRRENYVPGGTSSVVVARGLFQEVGGFGTDLEGCEDWELWLRLAAKSPVAYVDRPLVAYRRWEGNRSNVLDRYARSHAEVRRRHGIEEPAATHQQRQVWNLHIARHAVERGDRLTAAGGYARAALGGSPGQAAYAAAALASPRWVAARLRAYDRAALPRGWHDEARRWLSAA